MNEERMQAFEQEVSKLKLKGARGDTERWLFIVGSISLVAGVALAVVGAIQASGTTNPVDQTAYLATGTFLGLALVVFGTALFVRYSMGRFLRFWLIRIVHEHRNETDRLIDAIEKAAADRQP